jgi:N-acetyl-anhydromuramyl-L-alanine amidase AmpD
MRSIPLPYFDERKENIDTIIIHCVAEGIDDAIKSFHTHEVSAHYIIDEKGHIFKLVDEQKRAWHAGVSFWKKREKLNHSSIGIELCSKSFGQEPYPIKQIFSLIRLLKHLKHRYHIKKDRFLAHSDIAPNRRADPRKAFPWAYLARHGFGVWYHLDDKHTLNKTDEKKLLEQIGYNSENLPAAKHAFIRHFMGSCLQNRSVESLEAEPYNETPSLSREEYIRLLQAVAASFI